MNLRGFAPLGALAAAMLAGCKGGGDPLPSTAMPTAAHSPTSAPATSTSTATVTSARTATETPSPTIKPAGPGRCTEAVDCDPTSFSTARSQESCCDLALQLAGLPFSWCPSAAIDESTGDCSQCVAHPCLGLATRTPTTTAEPSFTATPSPTPTPTTITPTFTPTPIVLGRCSRDASCDERTSSTQQSRQACCDLALMETSPVSWCPTTAIEEATGQCTLCFTDPCEGLPTPTATPSLTNTATPVLTPGHSSREARIRAVFEDVICLYSPKVLVCGDTGCTMYCDSFTGHGGTAALDRFETAAAASAAFEDDAHERTDFHGLAASFWVGEFPYSGVPDSSSHHGIFVSNCWLARSYAYDDTSFLDGPQPRYVLEELYQRATATGLFDDCDPEPFAGESAVFVRF